MKEIGGYFGLELDNHDHYHKNAVFLNTARNCFEYILQARKINKVYLPYYTCDVILEPIVTQNIDYEFYSIDENFDPIINFKLGEFEVLLYVNYFGIKQATVNNLVSLFKQQLVVDNSQAFFAAPLKGIDTFYSARKFVGVADGAYLYTDLYIDIKLQDISYDRMIHLLKRIDQSATFGFNDFRVNDNLLSNQPIMRMSKLTESILKSMNYNSIRLKRIENYNTLHTLLSDMNQLDISLDNDAVPMVYPFLCNSNDLKQKLIDNKIFVPTYWPNVLKWTSESAFEHKLALSCIYLPIDQRYDKADMLYISNVIKQNYAK